MKFTIDKREEIDSTNLEVIRRAKTGAPEGTLVQAERQISGRGRRGRAWESPAGSNLYMTLLLRPDVTMEQASVLTLIMALAFARGNVGKARLLAKSEEFDKVREEALKVLSTDLCQGSLYHTRTTDTDIDDLVCFGYTVECTCHERVIIRCIAENDKLRTP